MRLRGPSHEGVAWKAGLEGSPLSRPGGRALVVGALRLDEGVGQASVGGRELYLTPTEFRLLQALMQRRASPQSRKQLLERAWNVAPADSGRIQTRTVDMHVRRLRSKLGEFGSCIQTIRGFGYRLKVPDGGG
jgi:DNA-binding response OmpR family regulator